jgi:hypothetical protein
MSKSLSRLLAAMTCAASLSVYAAEQEGQPKPHKPPQAALDACKNSTESATCQFTGRDNETVTGACVVPRKAEDKTLLVCRPAHKDHQAKDAGAPAH